MKRKKIWIVGAIPLCIIILITLIVAPTNNHLQSGSTYNRQPDGYAAWFEYMSRRGVKLQRWEKSSQDLRQQSDAPITLLRIQPQLNWHYQTLPEQKWLQKGNNLIVLGVRQAATKAKFSTMQASDGGMVKIDTSRRAQSPGEILGDRFGAIVWKESVGKGEIIKVTTPYIAANAYQDYPANYEFLAQLVTQYNQPIWVDEYLHGYKDKEAIAQEIGGSLFSYLAQTPLLAIFIQGLILLLICLWGFNRRWGQATKLSSPQINNSQAYVEALAAVLEKAESSDFIIEVIGKEEQLQLQKQLGLGDRLLDSQSLLDGWQNQQGNKQQLQALIQLQSKQRHLRETELLNWLKGWHKIRNFSSKSTDNDNQSASALQIK
jgi:hypothetical protein